MSTYAVPVPADVVSKSGTLTRFPTAVHKDHALCLDAAYKIRDDFVSKVDVDLNAKTIGDYPVLGLVHVVAFTIPECLPERLALMTRFTDFTILNDDYYDAVDAKAVAAFNAELQRSLKGSDDAASHDTTSVAIKTKQFQASILVEMMVMDRSLAMDVMTTYSNGLEIATTPPSGISSLEEYLPIRLINCGLDVFQDMSCFGIGIHLTQEEKQKLSEIVNTALYTAALINDCHSWPKELKHHLETPESDIPFNAVCILMRQYQCSDIDALNILREKYVELQERHLSLVQKLEQTEGTISDVHRKYIMAAQYAASGSEFWSIFAPRYPTKEELQQGEYALVNESFQLSRSMVNGQQENHVNGIVAVSDSTPAHTNGTTHKATTAVKLNGHSANLVIDSSLQNGCYNGVNGHSDSAPQCPVKAPDEAVKAPYDYINTLRSKKIRETFIDALDSWLEVPPKSSSAIKSIIGMLHHSSLMLDDIEDNSALRRGEPSAHSIFGVAQTINSANYIFVCAFEQLRELQNSDAAAIFIEELKNLHCGQALDLLWSYHTHVPSVEEYMTMVDHKTGGLFRLCARLMQGESKKKSQHIDAGPFVTLLGRYFQVRDDYQNLVSEEYTDSKGFCEDLDEGKISLPLIYCLSNSKPETLMIKGILQHKEAGVMPLATKKLILARMRNGGALDSTLSLLKNMQDDIFEELKSLELAFECANPMLELVLRRLLV